jgi:hypothetical protein
MNNDDDILNRSLEQYARRFLNVEYFTDRVAYWTWFLKMRESLVGQFDFKNEYECYFGILNYLKNDEQQD